MISALSYNYRLAALMAAFVLYALFSSPTPDHPGWAEGAIGLFLMGAIGAGGFIGALGLPLKAPQPRWQLSARIFMIYGLCVPLLQGVMSGHDIAVIFRDLVGFIFLCLPLFLFNFVSEKEQHRKFFLGGCLLIGFVFAVRVLFADEMFSGDKTGLLYLANSPLVLFTALFLAASAGKKLFYAVSLANIGIVVLFITGAIVVLLAMFVDLQRASFAAMALTLLSLLVIGFIKAPLRVFLPTMVLAIMAITLAPYITDIAEKAALKTAQVGMNMRWQEAMAVWDMLRASPIHVLFGYGWGSVFESPAVGGLPVSYTHSLITYVFFKTGLIGLGFTLIYLFFVFEKMVQVYFSDPVKGNALMWPLLIPVFLYASHKSLDFGLLLTLVVVMAAATNNNMQTRKVRG